MFSKPAVSVLLICFLCEVPIFVSHAPLNHEQGKVFQQQQQDQETPLSTSDFMKVKLDITREIVGGLAMADFTKIAQGAEELKKLSLESGWNVLTTPDYLQLSAEFRGSTDRLRQAAASKNIDGTTLAYFEVTLNCVRCHKYIRDK